MLVRASAARMEVLQHSGLTAGAVKG